MRVLVANCSGMKIGYLAGSYPGLLGHLFSPGTQRGPWSFMPYALDNGAFPAFTNKREWSEAGWLALLAWAKDKELSDRARHGPRWALVPDVVGDRLGTIARWEQYRDQTATFGWPLAFAVQDGMTPADVPKDAAVVFVGGGHAVEVGNGWHVVPSIPARACRSREWLPRPLYLLRRWR